MSKIHDDEILEHLGLLVSSHDCAREDPNWIRHRRVMVTDCASTAQAMGRADFSLISEAAGAVVLINVSHHELRMAA